MFSCSGPGYSGKYMQTNSWTNVTSSSEPIWVWDCRDLELSGIFLKLLQIDKLPVSDLCATPDVPRTLGDISADSQTFSQMCINTTLIQKCSGCLDHQNQRKLPLKDICVK
ncbi:hypothetical protein AMECASPLE_015294 [Ameca splendens]|uniref:Uncharacterized protein n=1 Tax=Ameca splendens TaxID=208324 RepID=A0ABV0YD26_9TELE